METIRLYLWMWFGIERYKALYTKREVSFLDQTIFDDEFTTFRLGVYSGKIEKWMYTALGHPSIKILDEQRTKIVMGKVMSGEYYTKD